MDTKRRRDAFVGTVKRESPMHGIFENNLVPLTSPHTTGCALGPPEEQTVELCYFVDVKACTDAEREAIAQLMHRLGQGSIEEARAQVATLEPIPVREQNISGVSFPMRYVL